MYAEGEGLFVVAGAEVLADQRALAAQDAPGEGHREPGGHRGESDGTECAGAELPDHEGIDEALQGEGQHGNTDRPRKSHDLPA